MSLDHRLDLEASLRGQLIGPEHGEYDLARAVYNGAIDRRPAVIVRPLDAADVAAAIQFARAGELPVSVRAGAHGVAGHAVCEGGVMIDLRLLRDVRVDPVERVAETGGGATWIDFDPVCQRHGLVTPGGTFGTTGVGGLTLGGGIGYLISRHGLTLDNLLRAEVVTAGGGVLLADEHTNPDLFWALRGGGGNFGVVTRFWFRLHELRTLTGGLLVYDVASAAEVLRRLRDAAKDVPDELSLFLVMGLDRATGQQMVAVPVCWTGSSADARERIESVRSAPGLLVDGVRPTSYLQLQGTFGEVPFGARNYWKGHFVGAMPDELVDVVVAQLAAPPGGSVLIEPVQGLARRIPDETTAFANRHAAFNVSGMSVWESSADDTERIAWARAFGDGVRPYSLRGGGYLNYMGGDEPLERVEAAFGPEKFARLRAVKRRFDPDNLFRSNQNIPPAEA